MIDNLPEGNLLEAELPALQQATVGSIRRKIDYVGVKCGFEVTSMERFDDGRRLEVGVRPDGRTRLDRPYYVGVLVDSLTVAQVGDELASAFEDWAERRLARLAETGHETKA